MQLAVQPPSVQVTVYRWSGEIEAGPVTSPGKVTIDRSGKSYVVRATKQGYCPEYWVLYPTTNWAGFTDAVLGLIPAIIDGLISNGTVSMVPDPIEGTLRSESQCAH